MYLYVYCYSYTIYSHEHWTDFKYTFYIYIYCISYSLCMIRRSFPSYRVTSYTWPCFSATLYSVQCDLSSVSYNSVTFKKVPEQLTVMFIWSDFFRFLWTKKVVSEFAKPIKEKTWIFWRVTNLSKFYFLFEYLYIIIRPYYKSGSRKKVDPDPQIYTS